MVRAVLALCMPFGGLCLEALAQTPFFPLKDVKQGMRGIGKTVFAGDRIEDFQVEILGVLENIGPKQSLILARLSGGPLASTGVMQGMSGSPVYIDGKLLGAVAMGFPFSKEPIAGIRPIEEMVRSGSSPISRPGKRLKSGDVGALLPEREPALSGGMKMMDIATPVSFGGFTGAAVDHFAPQLRALGLEPRQGLSLGGKVEDRMGDRAALHPGSMISVQLMTGDLSVGADGTVTYIDGEKVYAFGHRFLSVGPTSLPFARAEVMALLPNLNSSFKISAPKELMGIISQDRNTAVSGLLGLRADLMPVDISVTHAGRQHDSYRMQMVNDPYLSPFLLQMAVFSSLDATERTLGAATISVKGAIEFEGKRPPIRLDNMYAGDSGSAAQISLSAAVPLSYVLQAGFDQLRVKRVALEIEAADTKKLLNIEQVNLSRKEVHPGGDVDLTVLLAGENGAELTRTVRYKVPPGASPGTLYFSVTDGAQASISELRQIVGSEPRSADQVIANANKMRSNSKAYVRVWRADPDYQVDGRDLPDPPPSIAMILAGTPSIQKTQNSKIGEFEIEAGGNVVAGAKTVQVEVKE
ncbi:MAG: SpoIVB peptidase S55 domain-containing protein [Bryobacteraceae bacterium]